jgi:hypothetical protein
MQKSAFGLFPALHHSMFAIPERGGAVGGREIIVEEPHMGHGGDGGGGRAGDGRVLVFVAAALECVRGVEIHWTHA